MEKMLNHKNNTQSPSSNNLSPIPNHESPLPRNHSDAVVKHSMHGVSHAIPGELDDIEKPPPVHYGIDQAIRSGSVALKKNFHSNESLTSIVKEPSLARGQSQESVVNVRVTSPLSSNRSPIAKKIIPLVSSDSGKLEF